MKKILSLLCTVALCFTLVGCGNTDDSSSEKSTKENVSNEVTVATTTSKTTTTVVTECKHQWEEANCEKPATCSICGEPKGEIGEHSWIDATCTEPKTCSVCGKTEGKAMGHKWEEATCEKPKTCSVCGVTEGKKAEHTWKPATCEEQKTCTACGKKEGYPLGHTWMEATCTEPQKCSSCGKTQGSALGHKWIDATYSSPKTCSVCGVTEGLPLEKTDLRKIAIETIDNSMKKAKSDFASGNTGMRIDNYGINQADGKNYDINIYWEYAASMYNYRRSGYYSIVDSLKSLSITFKKIFEDAGDYEANVYIRVGTTYMGKSVLVFTIKNGIITYDAIDTIT